MPRPSKLDFIFFLRSQIGTNPIEKCSQILELVIKVAQVSFFLYLQVCGHNRWLIRGQRCRELECRSLPCDTLGNCSQPSLPASPGDGDDFEYFFSSVLLSTFLRIVLPDPEEDQWLLARRDQPSSNAGRAP